MVVAAVLVSVSASSLSQEGCRARSSVEEWFSVVGRRRPTFNCFGQRWTVGADCEWFAVEAWRLKVTLELGLDSFIALSTGCRGAMLLRYVVILIPGTADLLGLVGKAQDAQSPPQGVHYH